MEKNSIVLGRNAVFEALKGGRRIEEILINSGGKGAIKKIEGLAREKEIPIRQVTEKELTKVSGGSRHQGVLAYAKPYSYGSVEEILALAKKRGEDPFLIILDGISDPQNLGAIIRSAECAGAHGVIVGKHGSAGLTETVAKVSAGAVEHLKCAKVTNLNKTIEQLKEKGIWIVASHMDGDAYYCADLKGPLGLIIGSEGDGISRLTMEKSDFAVKIPMYGQLNSLNASNAAAVLMNEVRRQRNGK